MEEKLQRLYWADDRRRIQEIIGHLNSKYLIGLYEKLSMTSDNGTCWYDEEETTSPVVEVKYDGCVFNASRKTLRRELVRRGLIRQEELSGLKYEDGSLRKTGTKEYKATISDVSSKGFIRHRMVIKSGKEIKEITKKI